ncbi:MAG TPA: AraC family transcriptional regulator [Cyclobacteriaceae bacterium]|nr:AraC family transcriptional regulator [Cyclobacteriaceae bacterium]
MKTYELHIKNMVCERCIIFVEQIMDELNIFPYKVRLGCVIFSTTSKSALPILEKKLQEGGLHVINNRDEITAEEIKLSVKNYLDELEDGKKPGKLSAFISDRLAKNYFGLSKLFSKTQGVTIESYFVTQKVDRVKRLLREGELNLSEIAYRLDYSNVQHASSQFRKVSGQSVSSYKATVRPLTSHAGNVENPDNPKRATTKCKGNCNCTQPLHVSRTTLRQLDFANQFSVGV